MNINELIESMKKYALEENVPIMIEESLKYIINIINENNYKNILEIGTAIAYSTIYIASKTGASITSIERDDLRYLKAKENVKLSGYSNITLIHDDALNTTINEKFDLIIIDAAKSQNIKFFEKYKMLLKENGTIIIDNMFFHDYVGKSKAIKSRNLRQLVRKLESFHEYLHNQNEYNVQILSIGDGLAICKKNI